MSNEHADAAIAKLNGADFGGRPLTVNEARPMVKREFGGGGSGGGGGRGRDGGNRRGGGGGGFGRY